MGLFKYLQQHGHFKAILPIQYQLSSAIYFDLSTQKSPFYGVSEVQRLIDITQEIMHAKSANFGVGAYGEARFIYQPHAQFCDRSIHLGLDLTVPVETPVMTPLDATVHSVAVHKDAGNYGHVVILQHHYLETIFFTLYGHLSSTCLSELTVGQTIKAGERFAYVGSVQENGGWPPHLHLQIVDDLGEYTDTYPGVCSQAEKKYFLKNCPDPGVLFTPA